MDFMFAKDKDHMSGYVVMMFYVLIMLDFAAGGHIIGGATKESIDWFNLFLGISYLICSAGLIILLIGYKIGGLIVFIGSAIQPICGIFIDTLSLPNGGNKWGLIIGMMILHIILVSVVLFGERKYYLTHIAVRTKIKVKNQ